MVCGKIRNVVLQLLTSKGCERLPLLYDENVSSLAGTVVLLCWGGGELGVRADLRKERCRSQWYCVWTMDGIYPIERGSLGHTLIQCLGDRYV